VKAPMAMALIYKGVMFLELAWCLFGFLVYGCG